MIIITRKHPTITRWQITSTRDNFSCNQKSTSNSLYWGTWRDWGDDKRKERKELYCHGYAEFGLRGYLDGVFVFAYPTWQEKQKMASVIRWDKNLSDSLSPALNHSWTSSTFFIPSAWQRTKWQMTSNQHQRTTRTKILSKHNLHYSRTLRPPASLPQPTSLQQTNISLYSSSPKQH